MYIGTMSTARAVSAGALPHRRTGGGITELSLPEVARAVGGEVRGDQVLAPGPGHSRKDRSLSIRLSYASPDGFIVFSYAGDDWRTCRDYVADALGLPTDRWRKDRPNRPPDPIADMRRRVMRREAEEREAAETAARQRLALAIWEAASDPRRTIVANYLRSRCLDLPDEVAGDVLRFHPCCPWGTGTAPAMVTALRCIRTNALVGIQRTALTSDGRKVGRKMLGTAAGAAIKLDADETVTLGLAIAEGTETALAARQLGIRPVFALGSAGAIAAFGPLPGVEALTILGENDTSGANPRAAQACARLWRGSGAEVVLLQPQHGNDANDVLIRSGGARD